MLSRSTLKVLARLALTAMLFTQTALVFAACESAQRAPALVIVLAERPVSGENCHEAAINVNLCLAHCLGEDQSLDKPPVKVPAFSIAPVLIMSMVFASAPEASAPRFLAAPHAVGPPPRILFQSFLI